MTEHEQAMEQLARDLARLNRHDSAMPNQPSSEQEDET